jgi:phosphopantothenoylcysteine decarboxylase/phosphopantothenate--cysteine ligase
MAAAVADYRSAAPQAGKIKKRGENLSLELVTTPDILTKLASLRKEQVLVGFAAETENLKEEAARKLQAKGLDLIVANDISEPGVGIAADDNRVLMLDRKGVAEDTGRLPKTEIARKIFDRICRDYF